MTVPTVQDPREEMLLHCRFDMGKDELYAVKWYKDDHEFYRYKPGMKETIMEFPVPGVHVERRRSYCTKDRCDLILYNLERTKSSGAYRCEVSSEAPEFRLASQTHNVTVAALPKTKPVINIVKDYYTIGDTLIATCTSGMGDPKPNVTWYINQIPVSEKVKEVVPPSFQDIHDGLYMRNTTVQLKLLLDHKYLGNHSNKDLMLTCESYVEKINPLFAPPLKNSIIVKVGDKNEKVKNQGFVWLNSSSTSIGWSRILIVLSLTVVAKCC